MEPLHHDESAWPQRLVTVLQRSALLNLAWDHISLGLGGRESAFELQATRGIPTWGKRLRRWFRDYNELANGLLKTLDLNGLRHRYSALHLFGKRCRDENPPGLLSSMCSVPYIQQSS
jgi:hypothetical protein